MDMLYDSEYLLGNYLQVLYLVRGRRCALMLGLLAPDRAVHGLEPVGSDLLGLRRGVRRLLLPAGVARTVVLLGGGRQEAGLERHELLEHGAVVADRLLAAAAVHLALHPPNSCTSGNTST
jgi:hypothetical protein